jgi:hypothetical protein
MLGFQENAFPFMDILQIDCETHWRLIASHATVGIVSRLTPGDNKGCGSWIEFLQSLPTTD